MNFLEYSRINALGYPCDSPPGRKGPCGKDGSTTQEAYELWSPNVEEHLSFQQAVQRLKSDEQKRFAMISEDVDRQIGLHSKETLNAVGDWSDGAENSVVNFFKGKVGLDELRYSAAVKGMLANQKAVIPFIRNGTGKDAVYRFKVTDSLQGVREKLDKAGVAFRTLIPRGNQVEVMVFDPGTQLRKQVGSLAGEYDDEFKVKTTKGTGEFLGGDTRTAGRREYAKVIKAYEASHIRGRYRRLDGGSNNGRKKVYADAERRRYPKNSLAASLWTSPNGPDRADHLEIDVGMTMLDTQHPPSLKKPVRVKLPTAQDGFGKKATAAERTQGRKDLAEALRRSLHHIGGTPTVAQTAGYPLFPNMTSWT